MAVANAQEFFSRAFLAELEASSPFRFDFLRKRQRRFMGRRGLYAVLFDAFLEAGEGEMEGLPWPGGLLDASLEAGAEPVPEWMAVETTCA
jgi:hypothetical protein